MSAIISVDHLVKRYSGADKNAVDDISFTIKRGEFFTLLGPNGAGKTTTISILSTTLAKTSGTVTIDGHDLDKEASDIRRKLGIIFQNPSLDRNLTAEENIRFHATLYGLYPFRPTFSLMPQEYKKKVSQLAEVLDLKDSLFQAIKTFSGGMKRKLEIIRSLMHEPTILILDEPTSGLDPQSRNNLWDYVRQIQKTRRMTILLTTHYLEEAEDADKVCVIDHGKIVASGTPTQLKNNLIEEYLLIDAKDRTALMKNLKKIGVASVDTYPVKVPLHKITAQEMIQKITVPLSVLKIHIPTLEEAYLEIIRGENKDDVVSEKK